MNINRAAAVCGAVGLGLGTSDCSSAHLRASVIKINAGSVGICIGANFPALYKKVSAVNRYARGLVIRDASAVKIKSSLAVNSSAAVVGVGTVSPHAKAFRHVALYWIAGHKALISDVNGAKVVNAAAFAVRIVRASGCAWLGGGRLSQIAYQGLSVHKQARARRDINAAAI